MNTYCQFKQLNEIRPEYPIPSINSLFLPRFNNSANVNSWQSLNNRPSMPAIPNREYIPSPRCYTLRQSNVSSLPSGVGNFDRSAIRQFDEEYICSEQTNGKNGSRNQKLNRAEIVKKM